MHYRGVPRGRLSIILTESLNGISLPIPPLRSSMDENTPKTSWQTIWTEFVSAWKTLCGYHEVASETIGKAFDEGRLTRDEAISELAHIREEMESCKYCR